MATCRNESLVSRSAEIEEEKDLLLKRITDFETELLRKNDKIDQLVFVAASFTGSKRD